MADEKKDSEKDRLYAEDLSRLADFRLMDDDFFSETLDGKKEAVQYILNTVLERDDLVVLETKTQRTYRSAVKRSISLDIWAKDAEGRIADIEIQRADRGTGARRARMHSSMLDRDLLQKGQTFDEAAETFVIFITENDKFEAGFPVYNIDRTIRQLNHRAFGDQAHIVYVNGKFRDLHHPVGRLMHDFWCTSADDMLIPVLAEEVRYMKETEGGRRQMSRAMEEMRAEAVHCERIRIATQMLQDGIPADKTAGYLGLSTEDVQELAESLQTKASA